jgi:hypothetical protein
MQDERLPEDALFEFLIANLYGREDEIRPLMAAGAPPNFELQLTKAP